MFFIKQALAAVPDVDLSHMYDPATNLSLVTNIGGMLTSGGFNLLKFLFVIVGLLFFFNLVMAGWDYLLSSGDPKKVSAAGSRFTNSFLGILVALTAFLVIRIVLQALGLPNLI